MSHFSQILVTLKNSVRKGLPLSNQRHDDDYDDDVCVIIISI